MVYDARSTPVIPMHFPWPFIAATALALGTTLVTGNAKHFSRIKGLKMVDWESNPPA
jgi:predicted nucleic acid-binding protein